MSGSWGPHRPDRQTHGTPVPAFAHKDFAGYPRVLSVWNRSDRHWVVRLLDNNDNFTLHVESKAGPFVPPSGTSSLERLDPNLDPWLLHGCGDQASVYPHLEHYARCPEECISLEALADPDAERLTIGEVSLPRMTATREEVLALFPECAKYAADEACEVWPAEAARLPGTAFPSLRLEFGSGGLRLLELKWTALDVEREHGGAMIRSVDTISANVERLFGQPFVDAEPPEHDTDGVAVLRERVWVGLARHVQLWSYVKPDQDSHGGIVFKIVEEERGVR